MSYTYMHSVYAVPSVCLGVYSRVKTPSANGIPALQDFSFEKSRKPFQIGHIRLA